MIMRRASAIRIMLVLLLVCAVSFSSGCSNAFGMQDWQRDILGVVASTGTAFVINLLVPGLQATNIQVERNCFENGVPVDCSTLPNAGQL